MMHWQRRGPPERDQDASSFARILAGFCDAAAALGAALVDCEGETVDYSGRVDPFEIKVAAAEWRLILGLLAASNAALLRATEEFTVRARAVTFSVVALDAGYALVVVRPRRSFVISRRAMAVCVADLCAEAGLTVPTGFRDDVHRYRPVAVRATTEDPLRPLALCRSRGAGPVAWDSFEVLGRFVDRDAGVRSVGYRGRLTNGEELTVVRERTGRWYLDLLG